LAGASAAGMDSGFLVSGMRHVRRIARTRIA